MRKSVIALLASVSAMVSCGHTETVSRQTIPFVREMLDDDNSSGRRLLDSFIPDRQDGAIAIYGSPDRCLSLKDAFVNCDSHDNVDGRHLSDRLPDFAGETFSVMMDAANAPYKGYVDAGNEEFLREIAVRGVLSAIDTACATGPNDIEMSGRKMGAKIIVLESAFMSSYGKFDIDTLLASTGCDIPVLTTLDAMLSEVIDPVSRHGVNIGVVAERSALAAAAYSSYLQQRVRALHLGASDCISFPRNREENALTGYLDNYLAAGYTKPLDAILVDDFAVDVKEMRAALDSIRSSQSEKSLEYGRVLSYGFKLVDAREAVTESCYEILRSRNMFTHDIRYPRSETYMTYPSAGLSPDCYGGDGEFSETYRYSRTGNSDTQTYVLLEYSPRYLTSKSVTDVQD